MLTAVVQLRPAAKQSGVPSLQRLCIGSLMKMIEETPAARVPRFINDLCRMLPEHLMEPILEEIVSSGAITDMALQCFLLPSRTALRLPNTCHIRNATLKQIAYSCPNLCVLDLSDCTQVRNAVVRTILQGCSQLMELHLNRCYRITDAAFDIQASIFVPLYGCLSLKLISLQDCPQITGELVTSLRKLCQNLKCLTLARCKQIDAPQLAQVFEYSQLTSLNLSFVDAVSDECFVLLTPPRNLSVAYEMQYELQPQGNRYVLAPPLEQLNLCRSGITDEALYRLCTLRQLQQLSLQCCKGITDRGVRAIAFHCTLLRVMDLTNCTITDESLHSLAESSRQLQSLQLSWCSGITDAGVILVAQTCTELEEMGLVWCHITDTTLGALMQAPKLRLCDVQGCTEVSTEAIAALRDRHVLVRST